MHLKTDSFVVETDTHFPTDYNLLWDSARKCIDCAEKLDLAGWRKHNHWRRKLKGLMRAVGKTSSGGGPHKARRVLSTYNVQSLSVDKGFSDMADKAALEQWIPQVIMPKKGRRTKQQKAIESNIHELEHRGLDRCPDRTEHNFKRYIGMAVTAYNLHKIGRQLLSQRRADQQRSKAA